MNHTKTPLKEYLLSHNLVNHSQIQEFSEQELQTALIESGMMTSEQLQQLQGLLNGLPLYEEPINAIAPEVQSLVPYPLSQKHRTICVKDGEEEVCLLTDGAQIDPAVLDLFAHKKVTSYSAQTQVIDELLRTYHDTTYLNLIDSITSLEKKIRKEKDFGSELMSQFFPADKMREMAEDVHALKIWRRIVSLGQIMKAESISVQTRPDKVAVRMRVGGNVHDVLNLRLSVATSLLCAMRYYCDLPLKGENIIQKGYTSNLSQDTKEALPVWFTPTITGYSIDVHTTAVDEMSAKIQELGLSVSDKDELSSFLRTQKGMCVISGKEKSGKTYAYYQMIEACASNLRVVSIEKDAEYVVDRVNQTTWSKRPEKDLQLLTPHNEVIAVSDPREALSVILTRISQERKVILETNVGVITFVKHLIGKGMSLSDIARSCSYNLVSYSFNLLDEKNRAQYKLTAADLSTLEQYITIDEVRYILDQENLQGAALAKLTDIVWVTQVGTEGSFMSVTGLFKKRTSQAVDEKKYLRALVNINHELTQARKYNKTPLELEQSIKHIQKQSLLRNAIVSAARKEIDITELITMLRA